MVDQLHHSDLGERRFQTHTFSLHINKHTKFQVTAKCHHVTSHFAETQKQLPRTCKNNNMKNTTTVDFVKTPNLFFLERGWDRGKLYHKIICSWKKHFHSHWCSLSWTWNSDKQNNFFDQTKWKNSVIWSREKNTICWTQILALTVSIRLYHSGLAACSCSSHNCTKLG